MRVRVLSLDFEPSTYSLKILDHPLSNGASPGSIPKSR